MSRINSLVADALPAVFELCGRAVTYMPQIGEAVTGVYAVYKGPIERIPDAQWGAYEVLAASLEFVPAAGDVIVDGDLTFLVIAVLPDGEPGEPIGYLLGVNRK